MPPNMERKYNIFHVSKRKPYHRPANEVEPPSVLIDASGDTEQIVQKILDKKKENCRMFYLVQFYGDSKAEAIWMHNFELRNFMDLVKDFENKSRPGSRTTLIFKKRGECNRTTSIPGESKQTAS